MINDLKHRDITEKIIGAAFDVHKFLGNDFWPTPDLNRYLNLKNRVETCMALVDIAATQGDNLLVSAEIRDLLEQDLTYRDKQLLRLKDEVLDLEDFSESVALNEFTLDDFRVELTKYTESNRQTKDE